MIRDPRIEAWVEQTERLVDESAAPSVNLRDSILRAASSEASSVALSGYAGRIARFFDIELATAEAALASLDAVDAEPWFDDPVPGVRMRGVEAGPRLEGAACVLVDIQPGVHYPVHRHLGDEWCLFLRGRGMEGEREWHPGDVVRNPAQSVHPVLSADPEAGHFSFGLVLYEGVEFE